MKDLKLEVQLFRIETIESMVTIGAAGNHRLHACSSPGIPVILGILDKFPPVAHITQPAAAAVLVTPHDAEINAGKLEQIHHGTGHFPQVLIETEPAAGVEYNLSLFPGEVFHIQPRSPFVAISLGLHHHVVLFAEIIDEGNILEREAAVVYHFKSQLSHHLYGFKIIPVNLAGNVTAPVHHTFKNDIHQTFIKVTASFLEKRQRGA
jgi:hypothetical protein